MQPTTGGAAAPCQLSLEDLRARLAAFAAARDWDQFHTPRNLLLALMGEVGELAAEFQWRGEAARGLPGFRPTERTAVADELADVLLYTVRLADVCGVDLGAAALHKMDKASNAALHSELLQRRLG